MLGIGLLLSLLLSSSRCLAEGVVLDCTQDDLLAALVGDGTVTFDEDCTITITNTIVISGDVTIDGSGNTIVLAGPGTTTNQVRLFTVNPGASLMLIGITLQNGRETNGGALYISEGATVTASNCVFLANQVLGATGANGRSGNNSSGTGGDGADAANGAPVSGAAVYNAGSFSAFFCRFLTNTATGGNGGKGGDAGSGGFQGGNGGNGGKGGEAIGAAIFSSGELVVSDSTFAGNTCFGGIAGVGGVGGGGPFAGFNGNGGAGADAFGAGIVSRGTAQVENCTFEDNFCIGGDSAPGGTLENRFGANGARGGLASGGAVHTEGELSLTNCTFGANQANGGTGGDGGPGQMQGGNGGNGGVAQGGGLACVSPNSTLIVNCTFEDNGTRGGTNGIAGTGPFPGRNGSRGAARGGNLARLEGSVTLVNTILGTNYVSAGTSVGSSGHSAYGTFIDGGNNLLADKSITLGASSRRQVDPRLGGLSDNGGPTRTFPLLTNSPAIDAGLDEAAPEFDQRGVRRPSGAHVDIGAFELAFTITGKVILGSTSNALAGVTVEAGNFTTETDAAGNFTIPAPTGPVEIIPSLPGYTFSPASISLDVTNTVRGLVFTATRQLAIAGRIIQTSGTNTMGLGGVTVLVGTNSTLTTSNGNYSIIVPAGTYTVTPALSCYSFSPSKQVVVLSSTNSTSSTNNFIATRQAFSIRGTVRLSSAGGTNVSGLAGVTVTAQGAAQAALTDTNGNYALTNLCSGAYVLVPSLPGYNFQPVQFPVAVGPDTNTIDFLATRVFSASGTVSDGTQLLDGVTMSAVPTSPSTPGVTPKVNTLTTNGTFALSGLSSNVQYTVTPTMAGYKFQPPELVLNAVADTSFNFLAVPVLAISLSSQSPASNAGLQLSFSGNTGRVYRVQASTNLLDWADIWSNTSPVLYIEPYTTNYPERFFRLVP